MLKKKNLSLTSQGLKYNLKISFYLMSILPLLVCIYLVSNYILPGVGIKLDIVFSVLISIFIAIAGFYLIKKIFDRVLSVENDILMRRLKKLETKDVVTGLYNEVFIRARLQEEIKRAIMHHRPCAFILLDIDNLQRFRSNFGLLQTNLVLKNIASLIKNSVTEVDRVARADDDKFAIVLPEKNKRNAQDIAENIRKKIESRFSKEKDPNKRLTVSIGVSENPLDGIEAEELIDKAKKSLGSTKAEGKGRAIS